MPIDRQGEEKLRSVVLIGSVGLLGLLVYSLIAYGLTGPFDENASAVGATAFSSSVVALYLSIRKAVRRRDQRSLLLTLGLGVVVALWIVMLCDALAARWL
jgi:hypothetical protein